MYPFWKRINRLRTVQKKGEKRLSSGRWQSTNTDQIDYVIDYECVTHAALAFDIDQRILKLFRIMQVG